MSKKLCDWKKSEISDKRKKLLKVVTAAEYICGKCARVAKDKAHLCKPEAIE